MVNEWDKKNGCLQYQRHGLGPGQTAQSMTVQHKSLIVRDYLKVKTQNTEDSVLKRKAK